MKEVVLLDSNFVIKTYDGKCRNPYYEGSSTTGSRSAFQKLRILSRNPYYEGSSTTGWCGRW